MENGRIQAWALGICHGVGDVRGKCMRWVLGQRVLQLVHPSVLP